MKRERLRRLLESYAPSDLDEIPSKGQMLEFLSNHEDCFERSCEVGHFTASAWLLSLDQKEALLTHHAKLNFWCQLGGHCDGDPDLLRSAIREAQEESGILEISPISSEIFDLDIHLIPANKREKEHFHYDVRFLLQVVSSEKIQLSSESKDLRWFGQTRALLPTQHRSIIRMFDKWIQRAVR